MYTLGILFNSHQFGFRAGNSTEDTLTSLSLFLNAIQDSGTRPAVVVFLDSKKAFDSMHHEILLGKLDEVGVCDKVLDCFRSYRISSIYTGNDSTHDVVVNFRVSQQLT